MGKSIEGNNGIKIVKSDKRAAISQEGIIIQHEGRPIHVEFTKVGFVYLVVDCSGSMEGDKLNQAKKGAFNFAKDALTKEYSIGLIQFESVATHICEPTRDIEIFSKHLQRMGIGGGTNMSDAIRLATEKLKGKAGFLVMVIITDGMPDNVQAALEEANKAKKNRIDIITIGTDDADEEFLKKLASRRELNVMIASNQLEKGISSTVKMLPRYGKEGQ